MKIDGVPSTPHERAQAFFARSVETAQFSRDTVVPVLAGFIKPLVREQALILLYLRMHGWAETVALLNRGIHFQAAAAAARSMFELLVDLHLLVADKDGKDVERFLAFPEVEKFRVASNLVKFRKENPGLDLTDPSDLEAFVSKPGKADYIEARRAQYWGTNRKKGTAKVPTHWSGVDMAARVSRIGLKFQAHYVELYSRLSWKIHSGSVGIENRDTEAIDNACGHAHAFAQEFFLQGMSLVGKPLRLFDAIPDYGAHLDRLWKVAGYKLLEAKAARARKSGSAT